MAIPDNTYFGPENVTFGTVRATTDPRARIQLLKKRLDSFFIGQVDWFCDRSPFPVTIMTCIGIETLGKVFFVNERGTQSFQFCKMIGKVHQVFARRLPAKFQKEFKAIWPTKDVDEIDSYGDLLYTYLRNTLIHGYYAQAVYLDDDKDLTYKIGEGFLVINPKWFWKSFIAAYELLITEAENGQENNVYRNNCLMYIERMLA